MTGEAYQEVYELLCGLSASDLKKIPTSVLTEINERRNKDYKTKITVLDLYNPENISKEALEKYFKLDYEYIMTKEEREYVDKCE